jgi:23S rRNA (uridine2552-2'-O)-methyltransferase
VKKVRDHYFQRAKQDGYAARSVYKLEEIDRKHRLFRPGMRALDLGCSPGSWLQYAARRVGPQGSVVGLDLKPIGVSLPSHAQALQGDIFEAGASPDWLSEPLDIILSDMAPKTTGVRSLDADRSHALNLQVLELADFHLRQGGTLLVKAFQGAPFEELRKFFRERFERVNLCKPKSSRQESVEIFILGQGKKSSHDE